MEDFGYTVRITVTTQLVFGPLISQTPRINFMFIGSVQGVHSIWCSGQEGGWESKQKVSISAIVW
jgi:hypothetical protein